MSWLNNLELKLTANAAGLREKDLRFYHLDTFYEMAAHTDKFADTCPVCASNKLVFDEVANRLSFYMGGTPKGRKEYDKKYTDIEKHLKKAHRLVPQKLTQYTYLFLGMLLGLLVGTVLAFAINALWLRYFLFAAWVVGTLVGHLIGRQKENKIQREQRYL